MSTRTRIAFATAVCLTTVGTGRAEAQRVAARSCDADEIVGWVGLEQLDCNCTVSAGRAARTAERGARAQWSFRSEPVVGSIRAGSPADGVLRRGDVIVAVDGHLITTSEGGRRFSHPRPNEALTLRIRRDGRETNVRLTPIALCVTDPRLTLQTPRAAALLPTPQPSRVPQAPGRARSAPAAPPTARAVAPAALAQVLPPGRLGFGYSCSSCGWSGGGTGAESRLFFEAPPQVYSVEPGSPADLAGLRRGDIITHVDGVAITSDAGARRFADIEPHEAVRYRIRRGTATEQVTLRAVDRRSTEPMSQRELRERIARISRMEDPQAARQELVSLARQLETPLTEAPAVRARGTGSADANRLRYSGQVGDAEIEVRGSGSVIATILEPDRDLRIVTDQATIRIRIPREVNR